MLGGRNGEAGGTAAAKNHLKNGAKSSPEMPVTYCANPNYLPASGTGLSCPFLLDRNHVALALFPLIEQICPLLHHHGTIFEVVSMVVGATNGVRLLVGKLSFYPIRRVTHFVQASAAAGACGMRAEFS